MRPNLAVLNFWCYPCIYEDIYTEVSGKKPREINTNVLNTDFPILSILIRNKPGKTRFNEKRKERETFTSCYGLQAYTTENAERYMNGIQCYPCSSPKLASSKDSSR